MCAVWVSTCSKVSSNEAAFPSEHFDVITAAELVEHLCDPQALLHEVARILRPGGLFWMTTPHARGLSGRCSV